MLVWPCCVGVINTAVGSAVTFAKSVIADYEQQFNRIPQKRIDLARLQRTRMSTEKLYLLIEEKYNEAAITEKSEFGYVDIIDAARVPGKPVSPKVAQNMILAVLAGLGLAERGKPEPRRAGIG